MNPEPPEIVLLASSDLERHLDGLAELLHACVAGGASVNFVMPFDHDDARRFWNEKIAPGLAAGTRVVLIAKVGRELAGTVQIDLAVPPNQRHRAEVAKLLVHPRHRQIGLARALMQRIEVAAIDAGRWLLTLDTGTPAAEHLYTSLGFLRAGSIPAYARHPVRDEYEAATFMYKILERPRAAD